MNFLVQKVNNRIVNDFCFELTLAKDYLDWRREKMAIRYLNDINLMCSAIKNPDRYIPVGTVEFVSCYLKAFYPEAIKALRPLNVPEVLFPFAGRAIVNVNTLEDIKRLPKGSWYWKSNKVIKHIANGVVPIDADAGQFIGKQVSQFIPIDSEWRLFIFKNKIQYAANYAGDPLLFPRYSQIMKMVETYSKEAPVAYTLDVGINLNWNEHGVNTFVIECHRFFSCGLYGFNDHATIPYMFSQEWSEMKNLK